MEHVGGEVLYSVIFSPRHCRSRWTGQWSYVSSLQNHGI